MIFLCATPRRSRKPDRFDRAWVITLACVAAWAALILPLLMLIGG